MLYIYTHLFTEAWNKQFRRSY